MSRSSKKGKLIREPKSSRKSNLKRPGSNSHLASRDFGVSWKNGGTEPGKGGESCRPLTPTPSDSAGLGSIEKRKDDTLSECGSVDSGRLSFVPTSKRPVAVED